MIALSWLLATVAASQTCLYCKRMDTTSGFLYNYDFCPDSERCLENPREYINLDLICPGARIRGYALDIKDNCDAYESSCAGFVSSPELVGVSTTMNSG